MAIQIQYRRGTAAQWTATDPTLAVGEPGYETDTGRFKVGTGLAVWSLLPYASGPAGATGVSVALDGDPGEDAVAIPGERGFIGATGAPGVSNVPGPPGMDGEGAENEVMGTLPSGTASGGTGVDTLQTLTDGVNIGWDAANGAWAQVTLAGNRTMNAPTNMVDGKEYVLFVTQDGTGGRTLAWNAAFKWPLGVAPILSTGIGAIDMFSFKYRSSTLYGGMLKGMA